MSEFAIYLRNKKVEYINQSYVDFKKDFGIELAYGTGFTRGDFFHFLEYEGRKYVHKKAFEFMLSNGETYFFGVRDPEKFCVNPDTVEVDKLKSDIKEILHFMSGEINTFEIYPKVISESEHFYVFEYFSLSEYEELTSLNKEDGKYINDYFKKATKGKKRIITPFQNQMFKKILRHKETKAIKMKDLKSLEMHNNEPLGILFYNDLINVYYLLERRYLLKGMILKPLSRDFPIKSTRLIKLY